jgi:hypothetical protein
VIVRWSARHEPLRQKALHDLIATLRRDGGPARDLGAGQAGHPLENEQHCVLRVTDAVLLELLGQLRLIGPRDMT